MIDKEAILATQCEFLADLGIEFLCYDDGLVECPGKALHTTPSAPSDCKVFVNEVGSRHVMRLHCFHSSCREIITEVNDALYRIATKGGHQPILAGAAEGSPRKKLMPTGPDCCTPAHPAMPMMLAVATRAIRWLRLMAIP